MIWVKSWGVSKKVVVPELNLGQLSWILRAKYLVDEFPMGKFRVSRSKYRNCGRNFSEHIN